MSRWSDPVFWLSVAAGLGTALFLLPQVLRTWRQGVQATAPGMFWLSWLGNGLWLAYSLHHDIWSLLVVSLLAMGLSMWQLALIYRSRWKRRPSNQRRPTRGA